MRTAYANSCKYSAFLFCGEGGIISVQTFRSGTCNNRIVSRKSEQGGRAVSTVSPFGSLLNLAHLCLVPTGGSHAGLQVHNRKIDIQGNTVLVRWIGGTKRI
jgi:hypothetical protein